jgi:hypothetical protein
MYPRHAELLGTRFVSAYVMLKNSARRGGKPRAKYVKSDASVEQWRDAKA